jgi:alcohol-forming fatty acyl-CoA reductase
VLGRGADRTKKRGSMRPSDEPSRDPAPKATSAAQDLHGHLLLTGGTGFLGQATLEKLLSAYPDVRVSLLIRERRGVPGARRLETLMLKPVFASWRERLGDGEWQRAVSERVSVIEGHLGDVSLPGDIDVVIHAASTVSFDRPIDESFATNVSGVVTLYQTLAAAGADPHVVHVSTAYVAGMRKGVVTEATLSHTVDWRGELASARAVRDEVERDSRRPETLRRLSARAHAAHGKAGPQSVAAATEQSRQDWVARRLVDYGRSRAQSLGWPDVYTFTKALGERVAEELWAGQGHRLSIVRPAIVESSLRHPYPGWIDGFKMAEPIIIAYGQGILPEFPGAPDSLIDVIPVDLVVNAMLAVAGTPPEPAAPGSNSTAYFHVGSGRRNPLAFRDLYGNVREYFRRHPLPAGDRGHVRVPTWRFPGFHQVDFMLRSGERATALAERALLRMPGSQRTQEWMTSVHRQRSNLEFLRRYSDLYEAYTRAEVIYDDSRTLALHRSLPDDRVADHGFDPAVIDWPHYLQEIHTPAVTALVRSQRAAGSGRSAILRAPSDLPERDDVAAVFDLEGTVVASNLVESYLWARLSALPRSRWSGEVTALARSLPRYLRNERRDRGEFIRAFLRRYAGANEAELAELFDDVLSQALLERALPEAVRQVRRHRAAGHRTILITGAIDVLVRPLEALFDEVVASRMHAIGGVLTGHLQQPPLVDEARAAWLQRHAASAGLDLSGSYAYGDSYSDRPLLELVGHPVAVNPDPALYAHARRRHWAVENWGTHARGAADVMIDTLAVRQR